MNELGVAVVGAGYWGPNLVRNFLGSPDTELRWVCDTQPERAEKALKGHNGVKIASSIDEVLADPGVEAVAIATPPASHLPLGVACLEAGRHVLMEKPLAQTVAAGEQLVRAAERHDRVLMCDHTFCFTPAVRAIHRIMHDGTLGELHYLDSIRVNLGLVQSEVDVFWDLAPHDLSILDYILPEGVYPVEVAAYGADPIGAGQSCIGYLTLPLNTGAIVHVSVNWLSPSKIRQMIIAGSKSMVVWDDMKPYQRVMLVDCGVEVGPPAVDDEKRNLMVSYRMGDMVVPALPETGEALQGVVRELVSAIREHRAPVTDGRSGLRILKILEAAAVSIRANGAMVRLEGYR